MSCDVHFVGGEVVPPLDALVAFSQGLCEGSESAD